MTNGRVLQISGFNLRAVPIRKGARTCLCTASALICAAAFTNRPADSAVGKESLIRMSDEAQKKFWETPELLEKLLHFLDPESTYHLAQAHDLTKTVLQGQFIWNQFIRRSCPRPGSSGVVNTLVALLKLMKNPSRQLLDLLDVICDRFSTEEEDDDDGPKPSFHMSCQRHPDGHLVSFEGLHVLEVVESAFGSAKQSVEAISGAGSTWLGSILDHTILSALSARLVRQQKMMSAVSMIHVDIGDQRMADAFKTLLEFCPPAERTRRLSVKMSSEGGGWEWDAMAGALRLRPNILFWIQISKQLLGEGVEEDIRHVWEGVGCLVVEWEQFSKIAHGETANERLMQVKGMSELEWEQSAFGEEDDDEEDEEEDEGEEEEEEGGEDEGEDDVEEEDDQDEEELDAEQAQ